MSDIFGLEQRTAFGRGAENLGQGGQNITQRLNSLFQVLESHSNDLKSPAAEQQFRNAQEQLRDGFEGLKNWCTENGVNLGLGDVRVTATEEDSEQDFANAAEQLPPINNIK